MDDAFGVYLQLGLFFVFGPVTLLIMHQFENSFFDRPVEYLKGVGPQRAELLKKELNIHTFGDLIRYYPFRYVDRSKFYTVSEVNEDLPYIQLKGTLVKIAVVGEKRAARLTAQLKDQTGTIELVWFKGLQWLRDSLHAGVPYIVFGKATSYNNKINIVHPEMEMVTPETESRKHGLQGIYSNTEKTKARGLDSKGIFKLQKTLAGMLPNNIAETLPANMIADLRLMSLHDAWKQIHLPADQTSLRKAQFRLKFEELFYIQFKLLKQKAIRLEKYEGKIFSTVGNNFNDFYHLHLPFPLTDAQKRVLKEIRQDMKSGKQMNRLLQGDVGSGKTIVALMTMLLALDNGCQACLMAPTEILATQHYETLSSLLKNSDIQVELLTGSTRAAKRKILFRDLADHKIQILIGTHALIEDNVIFNDLGVVVIDEQHRFGVEQRARLWNKEGKPAHVLVMTATPIPRTLAMTLYGDLDVSVIDEMPPGRKPIQTLHKYEANRLAVFGFMKQQIRLGRQVYVVYPLIEESEKMDYNNLMEGYESIMRDFPVPEFRVSIVHGRMKAAVKDYEMKQFAEGKTNILVATTVIEVGVNVPNASVMVIESAQRFGLSQLHQLRGRVGRGADQSYCIMITDFKLSADSRTRMETMVRTNDGFEIAETDLKLRGPGDLAGTQQSGLLDLRIADLAKDIQILETARAAAIRLIQEDPSLSLPVNSCIAYNLSHDKHFAANWSRVS
jgi:ATP-dependent DNA helicase RecG